MAEHEEKERKRRTVIFELLPEDYEKLEAIAAREPTERYGASGVSPHQYMRRLAIEAIAENEKKGKKKA